MAMRSLLPQSIQDFIDAIQWRRLVPSVALGALITIVPYVRDATNWLLTRGLEAELANAHGSAKDSKFVLVQAKNDNEIGLRPLDVCANNETDCYVAVKVKTSWMVEYGVGTALTSSLLFMVFGFVLAGRKERWPKAGEISVDVQIDENEIATNRVTYSGLIPGNPKAPLRIPVRMNFTNPEARDKSVVGVQSLTLKKVSDPAAGLKPPFREPGSDSAHKLIEGHVEFPLAAQLPASCILEYQVAKNFCLTLEGLKERWGNDQMHDEFAWKSFAECEEATVTFRWPASFVLDGDPTVHITDRLGVPSPRPSSWKWTHVAEGGKQVWTLHAKHIAPETTVRFTWRLGAAGKKQSPSTAPAAPAAT